MLRCESDSVSLVPSPGVVRRRIRWTKSRASSGSGSWSSRKPSLDGARDAIQVLTAFIEDLSTPTSNGLPDYLSPEPVVVSRAMTQLRKLTSDATLGVHTADISRANLHGISLPNYRPQGALLAVAADFRRANLHGLVLSTDSNSFRRAFLTCTDLSGSTLVNADLQYTDLSGADLRGADLGHT